MAVTIGTNVRGWYEGSTTIYWTARCLWDTGSALYAVVQDTGATPKVRVMKADSRTAPTSWSEQDSADNKTITNVNFPYSSWLHTNGDLHIVVFTATNTITHYVFDTDTDQWATGNGNVTTAAFNERLIRCVVRSDGDVLVTWVDVTDDADIGWARWEPSAWTVSATGILAVSTTQASTLMDMGIDSTDRAWVSYYDAANDDVSYRSINSANTVAAEVDIETNPIATETSTPAGSRFNMYDASGTDTIIIPYLEVGGEMSERIASLEADAAGGNLATEAAIETTPTDLGTRTPISTAAVSGTPYVAWWDDASSGTIKYSTKSGGAWAAETNFATSITRLIEIVPVAAGLIVVYQSSNDVIMDTIVALTANVTVNGSLSTATAAALSALIKPTIQGSVSTSTSAALAGSIVYDINGSLSTATGAALDGTVLAPQTVNGSLSTASALANAGSVVIKIQGSISAASAAALSGALVVRIPGALATASGAGLAGSLKATYTGSLATASAAALDGDLVVVIVGSTSLADAAAGDGTVLLGYTVLGSLATASAQANDGTASETGAGDDEPRSGIFQLRPLVAVEA
jgi:hypothetical protein